MQYLILKILLILYFTGLFKYGTAILEVISFGEQMRSPGVEIVTDYTLFFMCHVRSLLGLE
ncbi:MAG: hypothetical protein IV298_15495 [Cylindrospermopsis raciborskii KL1]|uniref:hypothetical protein n=1 Tax=Cylindrospermopsis raciborskii TaxID=77022 RepID=UPI001A2B9CDB|nr:hypothetical protein [Cylindrospermopsis raciborskii]MBG0744841.1 hypothetical protein [Cylindrospermopsis raciborskii KL1]